MCAPSKQDGRLKEHIRSKHGEQAKEDPGTGDSSTTQEEAAISSEGPGPPVASTSSRADTSGAGSGGREKGVYFQKTPKMLLAEWCQKQKQKRPQPKYKALQAKVRGHD